ncbi:hypothetical protein N9O88_01505 [bacterium]|nr:hypothetical protein [bacterium]
MAEQTLMIPAAEFNPAEDMGYSKPRINKAGGKAINIINKSNNRQLHLSCGLMLTWGVNKRVDEQSGRISFDMSLQFPKEEYSTEQTDKFLENMIAMEEQIKKDAIENSKDWFNKAKLTEAQVDVLFNPMLYYPKDPETGERREGAAPTLRLKLDYWDEVFKCEVYDVNQEPLYPNDSDITPFELITKGSQVATIIRCGGVYFVNGKFGVTWRLHQALVKPKASLTGKCFISLSPDEVEKMNTQKNSDDETNSSDEEVEKDSFEQPKFEGVTEEVTDEVAEEVAEVVEEVKPKKRVVRRKKADAE